MEHMNILQLFLMLVILPGTTAIYCNGVETFEKVSGMTMRGASSSPLYMSTGSSVTAECNMRCRASLGCSAYVTNYDLNACFRVDSSSSFEHGHQQLVMATERLHYFEKICLQGPVCDRAWSFERVLNHQLMGFDTKMVRGVGSRQRCEEMCLMEKDFMCLSAEYDGSNCRMSKESRRTQPAAYSSTMGVEYMENQCAQSSVEVTGECNFEPMPNTDVSHADLQRAATSLQQCQDMCEGSRLFPCRTFSWNVDTNMCRLSADDMHSVAMTKMRQPSQGTSFYQRSSCLNMSLDCSADMMTVTLRTPDPFMGRIYARDEPMLCEAFGNGQMETQISMMLHHSRCGVTEESPGMFSNIVVIQQHPILQRRGDKSVKLMCFFEADNRTVTSGMNVVTDNSGVVDLVNSTAPPPTVQLRIVDVNGTDVMGATLGDQLFLRIEIDQDSPYDIFPRDLVTRSGTTAESIVLLDSAGCPTDPTIFPGLQRIANSKSYEGPFEAFKFSADAVVRFTVNIQFCLRQCPLPECNASTTPQPTPMPNHMLRPMSANKKDRMPSHLIDPMENQEPIENDLPDRSKRDIDEEVFQPLELSELNLQRQLLVSNVDLVENIFSTDDEITNKHSVRKDQVCLNSTLLLISGISLAILQVCIITTCAICLCLRKPRNKKIKEINSESVMYEIHNRAHNRRI